MIHRRAMSLEAVRADLARVIETHAATVDDFHALFYGQPFTWGMSRYRGHAILKNPCDLWIYQEVIFDTRPTLVVDVGTGAGGSAWYFADTLKTQCGGGRVISIDVDPTAQPPHPGVTYWRGSSVDPAMVAAVAAEAQGERVMVVLDSDHTTAHVRAELNAYGPLVTQGCYLAVEDTNLVDGPLQAVLPWVREHPEYEIDPLGGRYLLTFQPSGWLRRVA